MSADNSPAKKPEIICPLIADVCFIANTAKCLNGDCQTLHNLIKEVKNEETKMDSGLKLQNNSLNSFLKRQGRFNL